MSKLVPDAQKWVDDLRRGILRKDARNSFIVKHALLRMDNQNATFADIANYMEENAEELGIGA